MKWISVVSRERSFAESWLGFLIGQDLKCAKALTNQKKRCRFFHLIRSKAIPTVTCLARVFPRIWQGLHVSKSNSDWFTQSFTPAVIGQMLLLWPYLSQKSLATVCITFPPQRFIKDISESLGGEQFSETNIGGHLTNSSWW